MTLRLRNLRHIYREPGLPPREVLNIPVWSAEPGETILLRGKSGSGKTTLLNLISGLLTPTEGAVEVAGVDMARLPEAKRDRFRARHVGYVFQLHHLLPLTALENVEMPLAFLGENSRERRTKALQALESVGLSEWARNKPAQLSTGQRLRVAIARALVIAPPVLLADEPTAALDGDMGLQVVELLERVCAEQHAILIVASHDPALINRFQRVVNIEAGQLQEAA